MHALTLFSSVMLTHLMWASVQAAVLVGLLWLVCRLLPRLPATVRSALWWLVAAQLLIGLAWPVPVRLPILASAPAAVVVEHTMPAFPVERASVQRAAAAIPLHSATHRLAVEPTGISAALPWRQGLIALWLSGLLVQLAFIGAQWQLARHLRRTSRAARDPKLLALCERLSRELDLRVSPELRISDAVQSLQVSGLSHPVVLLPAKHTLAPEEYAMALAHELAHLRRGDLWWGWAPIAARTLFFFHPLIHVAVREYALNREAACDSLALRLYSTVPQVYGKLLIRLGVEPSMPVGLAGMASPSFRHLKRRLVMMEQSASLPRVRDWALVLVVALAFIVPYRAVAARQPASSAANPSPTLVRETLSAGSSGHLSVEQDNGRGSLKWHDGSDALVLRSNGSNGIQVVTAKPDGLFGLHGSDVILKVDGKPVGQVGALLDRLRDLKHQSAKLLLRRNGTSRVVTLVASDYERILPPPPPPPPPVPAPPAPPPPPPPPPPVSAGPDVGDTGLGFNADNIDVDTQTQARYGIALLTGETVWVAGDQSDLAAAKRLRETDSSQTLWFRTGSKAYVTHNPAVIRQAEAIYADVVSAQREAAQMEGKKWEVKGPLEGLQSWQQSIDHRLHSLQDDPSAPAQAERIASLKRQQRDVASRIAKLRKQLVALQPQEAAMAQRVGRARGAANQQMERLVDGAVADGKMRPTAI